MILVIHTHPHICTYIMQWKCIIHTYIHTDKVKLYHAWLPFAWGIKSILSWYIDCAIVGRSFFHFVANITIVLTKRKDSHSLQSLEVQYRVTLFASEVTNNCSTIVYIIIVLRDFCRVVLLKYKYKSDMKIPIQYKYFWNAKCLNAYHKLLYIHDIKAGKSRLKR